MKKICCLCGLLWLLASCISTKSIPDDDQLFVGLNQISYDTDTIRHAASAIQHEEDTKAEVELALATAPNGALFGSSYYRSPFSWRLWVYNKYSNKESNFAKWMVKTFGKPPVLMSQVNPALRASVAQSVLRNNGYFRGNVTYETVPQKNPKKGKIAYHVHLDSLFTYDSIAYVGFPEKPHQLLDSTAADAVIQKGAPFSVNDLESERNRISTLLRNNGYYYYTPSYATYLADTVAVENRAQLRIQLADGLPEEAMRQWYIGNISIQFRRSAREAFTDSIHRRHLSLFFNGKRPPIRPGVVLKNMRLFPRQAFSYEKYQETAAKVNATGVFSAVDFQFTPRTTDTLDLRLNCTFDKPFDFYFETNFNARTIGRYGPEMKVGFTKRNAFRGAELLDINLHGNYEWQKGGSGSSMNSYQYGVDASIEFPRIIAPFYNSNRTGRNRNRRFRRRFFASTPTTLAKASVDVIHRPGYYRMNVVSGEWTYRWQSSRQSWHEFSPLTLKYQHTDDTTDAFTELIANNLYLATSLDDKFIPKIRYTYTYTSPATLRNPIRWETTIAESGNLTALYDVVVQGNQWNQKGKTLFRNPYAQFLRLETDFTKTWQLSGNTQLVGHLNGGIIYSYGNSDALSEPFSETFYIGGANSIRAFAVRGIGPGGSFDPNANKQLAYLMHNGNIKLLANLEFRTRLFGDLNGAVFLDMGNVWNLPYHHDEMQTDASEGTVTLGSIFNNLDEHSQFRLSRLLDQTAVGTGVGLRYDLGFLVIRIDWGVALHLPYDTGRSGYFNWGKFKDAQALHFAIGYPF